MRAPLDLIAAPRPRGRLGNSDAVRAFAAKRYEEAADLARAQLAQGAADPVLYDIVAYHLRKIGDFAGAAIELEQAERLDPQNMMLTLNLGVCLLRSKKLEAARARFERVVAAQPDNAKAHYHLGVTLNLLHCTGAARQNLERVVALEPENGAALGALAQSELQDGVVEAARAHALEAVRLAPARPEGHLVLGRLEADARDYTALRERMERLLADPEASRANLAEILLLLGDALDGLGEHAAAFEAYTKGKAQLRERYVDEYEQPGQLSARELAEEAMTRFSARGGLSRTWQNVEPGPARRHVFLMGFPRSGTTLLEHMLESHPQIACLGEMPTILEMKPDFMADAEGFERLSRLDREQWDELRAGYWDRVRGFGAEPDDKVFVDKLPLATLRLPVIGALFPEARVLFAIRDPRDVVLSCFRRNFRMNPSMHEFLTLEGAARFYDTVMRAGMLYRERLPLEVHEVRHERVVADFDTELTAICSFLSLDFDEEMRSFAEKARARRIRTPSAPQVVRGLYTDALGHWRNYRAMLEPVLPILEPWVERFGYSPSNPVA
jgi:tetratricopeptide (TPR) repeat protein